MLSEADIERAGGVTIPKLTSRMGNDQLVREGLLPRNWEKFPLGEGERYGLVMSNCRINTDGPATSGNQTVAVSGHSAYEDLREFAVVIGNFNGARNTGKREQAGWDTSLLLGAQYPGLNEAGRVQLLSAGSRAIGMGSGRFVCTDFMPMDVLQGTLFQLIQYIRGTGGYSYENMASNAEWGEGSTDTVADRTFPGSGALPAARSVNVWPYAIIARTRLPSALALGDSQAQGTADFYQAGGPDALPTAGFGMISRALSPFVPVLKGGIAGTNLAELSAPGNLRYRLTAARQGWVTNVIHQGGVNSLGSMTADQMKAALIDIWQECADALAAGAGGKVFQTTITPSTVTSTDNFVTLAGQTPNAANPIRVAVNDWLRDGSPAVLSGNRLVPAPIGTVGALRSGDVGHPLSGGIFDVADVVESTRNSGIFKVNGTANWMTNDGLHFPRPAVIYIRDSGVFDHSRLA
ncbi:hypothetical protein [Ancylobacter defluvii]|uniref:Uncharacterized protein n=1 Tax=Ancylobacter defluvii TaxID=1282440 RepID=A0A9W6JYP2_9HYPH|nr:hypothetical protein [Ancylobacter defluvii]MBS7586391.1 SGNH/GDSL hydrolase family protein [Ancylobacter defluvii]GLK85672.1 hypothetical protein GCM10017653_37420 [Ancylobacter defluvii]